LLLVLFDNLSLGRCSLEPGHDCRAFPPRYAQRPSQLLPTCINKTLFHYRFSPSRARRYLKHQHQAKHVSVATAVHIFYFGLVGERQQAASCIPSTRLERPTAAAVPSPRSVLESTTATTHTRRQPSSTKDFWKEEKCPCLEKCPSR
jgi:hypothetical protein